MDNSQFRNLLSDEKGKASGAPTTSSSQPFKTPMLGSRARSSIPMTPRSVAGYNSANDFARQVAEQKRLADGEPPTKKFRSSAAPKGTKLKQGYQDRTVLRRGEDSQDEKEKRLKALEEMFKLQQIDETTFEKLKGAIGIGGDVGSTHLVKGLDWKLLERVKKGDDVNKTTGEPEELEAPPEGELDEELDSVLEKEIDPTSIPGKGEAESEATLDEAPVEVLSRDEILRRLKASRTGKSMAPPPPVETALGDRFKKVGSGSKAEKKRFTETVKGRRREVLITTDKNGNTKRKVKWLDKEAAPETFIQAAVVQQPLGMEVPAEIVARQKAQLEQQQQEEDEDDDIFAGVGADYNPLAGLAEDSDESGSEGEVKDGKSGSNNESELKAEAGDSAPTSKRNYFATAEKSEADSEVTAAHTTDPTILAALKKAAALRQSEGDSGVKEDDTHDNLSDNEDPERALKRKQFLERLKQQDWEDARDLDLGFGESRFGDEDDDEGAVWEEGEAEKKGVGASRRRGPKKRKGNKDSVNDVMSVMEGRKKAGS